MHLNRPFFKIQNIWNVFVTNYVLKLLYNCKSSSHLITTKITKSKTFFLWHEPNTKFRQQYEPLVVLFDVIREGDNSGLEPKKKNTRTTSTSVRGQKSRPRRVKIQLPVRKKTMARILHLNYWHNRPIVSLTGFGYNCTYV